MRPGRTGRVGVGHRRAAHRGNLAVNAVTTAGAPPRPERLSHEPRLSDHLWRSLYYFNLYRLVLSGSLLTLALTGATVSHLGARHPTVFQVGVVALALMSVVNLVTITRGRPSFAIQANLQIAADIVLITALMHASNGVVSGLGLLLIVSVAAGAVVLSGRLTLFYAALASILVLLQHSVGLAAGNSALGSYTQAALLGIGLFVTGVLLTTLASRARATEALARQRALDLANLDLVNKLVVERMEVGVLAVETDRTVRLMNSTASRYLGLEPGRAAATLDAIDSSLDEGFARWRNSGETQRSESLRIRGRNSNIAARFIEIGDGALIFLEDTSRAHEEKLAALGRLTTAIAHEIRNPLAALSHAAQLLGESAQLEDADRRLAGIVGQQADRINRVVESVLYLGRRGPVSPARLQLRTWLAEFVDIFCRSQKVPHEAVAIEGPDAAVAIDPDHLDQIVFNLCSNALRHSPPYAGEPVLRLLVGAARERRPASLDIVDSGSGIAAEIREEIFEPFFTTEHKGTGLGLYIARELCEANQARLEYLPDRGGACFRISFPEPLAREQR